MRKVEAAAMALAVQAASLLLPVPRVAWDQSTAPAECLALVERLPCRPAAKAVSAPCCALVELALAKATSWSSVTVPENGSRFQ